MCLGLRIVSNTFLCISDIRYMPESQCRWLIWHEFVFVWSQRGPPKDEDSSFLSFWTNFRKKIWVVPINISLILVVFLYSWVANVDIRLMITETYLEPSQAASMGLFAKIVNGQKLLTTSVKKFDRGCLTDFWKILLNSSWC